MISILDVAVQLQTVLDNLTDFNEFDFEVQTQGFHIDRIDNRKTGKNFIPVFVSSMGGTNNPVPKLKQAELTIPITFYYPVRFKEIFFALNDYLVDAYVGKLITFGINEEVARCNISIPQFGEIVDLDFNEFKSWVAQNRYGKVVERMEPYLSMTITLYLSKVGKEFMFGDQITISSILVKQGETKVLEDSEPVIIERADIGSSETAPQQGFDDTYIKGFPANLGYTKELPLMLKNKSGYKELLKIIELDKNMQSLKVTITEVIPFTVEDLSSPLTVTNTYYITNYSRRTVAGSLVGISLTLAHLRT